MVSHLDAIGNVLRALRRRSSHRVDNATQHEAGQARTISFRNARRRFRWRQGCETIPASCIHDNSRSAAARCSGGEKDAGQMVRVRYGAQGVNPAHDLLAKREGRRQRSQGCSASAIQTASNRTVCAPFQSTVLPNSGSRSNRMST